MPHGSIKFVTDACDTACRSSLSNGEERTKSWPGGAWTGAHGAKCLRSRTKLAIEKTMNTDFLDDAEAHTLAKHQILQEYLKGWLPILAQGQRNRLLYFDGFAGCGELTGKHPGSPIVAVRTALMAQSSLNVPLEVKMVEKNTERCNHLRQLIEQERNELGPLSARIQI